MKTSAETKIKEFLRMNPVWFASGDLQRQEFRNKDNTLATPRTIVRRLEEMVEDGILEVDYRGKGHAFYRVKQEFVKPVYTYKEINGVMVETRVR